MSCGGDDEKDKLIKKLQEELAKQKQIAKDLVVQIKIPTSKQLQKILTRGLKKFHQQFGKSLGKKGRRLFDGFAYRVYMEYRVSRANGDDPYEGDLFSGDFCLDEMDPLSNDHNPAMLREFMNLVVKKWNNMTDEERVFFASGCNVEFGSASEPSDYDSDNEDDTAGAAIGKMSLGNRGNEFRFGVTD